MVIIRDLLNPILKHAPINARPSRMIGAVVVAFLAAINPSSFFTKPYYGAICWMILAWWFFNTNPLGVIRPRDSTKKTLVKGNPNWYQITKSFIWALLFNFIPLFFIYLVLLIVARVGAKAFMD